MDFYLDILQILKQGWQKFDNKLACVYVQAKMQTEINNN